MFQRLRPHLSETTILRYGTVLILLAAFLLVGDLLTQTLVGPWLIRDRDIRDRVRLDNRFGQLKVLGPGTPLKYRRSSNDTGNLPVLVDSHEAFAACGLRDDDAFGARVVADRGGMPWKVEELEGPSAHRACLEEVLATLPLESELDGMWTLELTFRTDLPTLRRNWETRHPRPPYVRWQDEWRVPGEPGLHTSRATDQPTSDVLEQVGGLVDCATMSPALTRLDLRYEEGQLVQVESSPSVVCVEEAARVHAEELLALLYLPEGSGPIPRNNPIPGDQVDWIEIAVELPLEQAL